MPKLTITSPYVHSRVDSNTFTMGNPMPESTLTLCPLDVATGMFKKTSVSFCAVWSWVGGGLEGSPLSHPAWHRRAFWGRPSLHPHQVYREEIKRSGGQCWRRHWNFRPEPDVEGGLELLRRKIRLIEGNSKCSHLKIDLLRDFAAGVCMSEAQKPIPHPPLHTVYVYTVYLFTKGQGGGGVCCMGRKYQLSDRHIGCFITNKLAFGSSPNK